jgi:hypothetical protein
LIHVANARLLVRRIPNARLQLVDDGHLFVLTTGSVATSIVKFLRDSNER